MGKRYKVFPLRATDKAEFFDATAEELRLLIALIERGGDADEEALVESSGITPGRCRASLRFWADAGVISEESTSDVKIIEEYPEVVNRGELIEESGVKVAEDIRNNNLKPLFDELAVIFEKNLTTAEAKIVSSIIEQYRVSAEYVATLAAHLKGTRGFTVAKLRHRAKLLTNDDIDTVELLEIYISEREKKLKCEWEIKCVLGIHDRNLSPTERKYFKAWSDELGFLGESLGEIIREAYDITVMQTGNRNLPYMDEILLSWSKAGLKTPEECREYSEKNKSEAKSAPAKKIQGILGIYDRNLSPTERKYFKAWSDELGFSDEIIREAYDITIMHTGNRSLPYMNEILLSWSKAGLKTPEECREYSEKNKPEAKSAPTKKKPKENKPRYGNFDIDEAFANALQRSYGEESEKK